MRGTWTGLVAVLTCWACAGAPAPVAPPVVPAPVLPTSHALPGTAFGDRWEHVLPEPGADTEQRDEILSSPMTRDADFQREVARWVSYWGGAGARWFPTYLERMGWFSATVDSTLAREGLPPSLRYLPIVESGYSPRAVSRARAVGLWQFMEPTARGFGMWVGPLVDERRNPYKSTAAAGAYLAQLRGQFGSWFLALAAYNSGPYRVQRLLDSHAPLQPRSDSLYWALRPHLPRETRDFVPKFFAAALVARDPLSYGVVPPPPVEPLLFDEVVVPDATTLDVVAEAADATQEEIERLNPEVFRGITPPGRATLLRVPAGKGWAFRERYDRIPPGQRVTFVEHRVARGETLSGIARRYGVPLRDLEAANPQVSPRRLQVGQRLTVPVAPRRRTGS